MANPFRELRERLLRAGVAPRHVRRYITELDDHLADLRAEEERAGRGAQDAAAAALVRLGGTEELARAMLERPQLRSWCSRAPWMAVGLAPLTALAGAYFLACMILWMGWRIFLPDAGTPFVRLDGAAVLFFGFGRLIYFGAPISVGWFVGLIAARQRLRAVWPAAGLVLIALVGGMARVHVRSSGATAGMKHVGMSLDLHSLIHGAGAPNQSVLVGMLSPGSPHVLMILFVTLVPYMIWLWQRENVVSV
jgi:hypothetical protein